MSAESLELALCLFAKAPIAGRVKTRLQTHCTASEAAEIAKILLEQTIIKAQRFWPGDVLLSVWLNADDPFLLEMQNRYSLRIVQQCPGDLGAKMRGAMEQFGYPAAVLGCDAPHLLGSDLEQCYETLKVGQNVLGPSLDGGYYLIGLARAQDQLFTDMDWGTNSVLPNTLNKAQSPFFLLNELNDIDLWSDLESSAELIPCLKAYLKSANLV